jgi:predicted DNA binding protein
MIDRARRSVSSTAKKLEENGEDIVLKVKNENREEIEAKNDDNIPSQAPVRPSEFRYTDRQHEVLRNAATTGVGGLNPDKTTIQALAREINMDEKKVTVSIRSILENILSLQFDRNTSPTVELVVTLGLRTSNLATLPVLTATTLRPQTKI